MQINWNQTRRLYRHADGDVYVRVGGGHMEVTDYIEGGRVETDLDPEDLTLIGTFTNAQISNGDCQTDAV